MKSKILIATYYISCILIIVLTSVGINIIHSASGSVRYAEDGQYLTIVSIIIAVISTGTTPLAFLASRVYDELIDKAEYVLWAIAYIVTLSLHIPCILVYGIVYGIPQIIVALSHLVFPFVFWPIVAIKRVRRNKNLSHEKKSQDIEGGMD